MTRRMMPLCLALAGCSGHRQTGGHDVDLNTAAQAAESDIANYAAARHRRHPPAVAIGTGARPSSR